MSDYTLVKLIILKLSLLLILRMTLILGNIETNRPKRLDSDYLPEVLTVELQHPECVCVCVCVLFYLVKQ
jgi:hypothetical protein